MPPAVAEEETETKVQKPAELLNAAFPERVGYKRKIIPLFDCFYRVNYHEIHGEGIDSTFVRVDGLRVIKYPEKKRTDSEGF